MKIKNKHQRPNCGTATVSCSPGCLPASDNRRLNPFWGWEWLKTPAVLVIAVGMLGALRVYNEVAAGPQFLKFPPLPACIALIVGGVILLAISAAAYNARYRRRVDLFKRKTWRTF